MSTIEIGTVLKPHALKGMLKVKANTHDAAIFKQLEHVFVGSSTAQPTKVLSANVQKDVVYVMLEGVNTIDKAELLRGKTLYANKTQVEPTKQGDYLIADLIGMSVVDQSGKQLGVLEDIDQFGAADVLNIRGDGRIWLVPFLEDLVTNINFETKQMEVNKELYLELRICD